MNYHPIHTLLVTPDQEWPLKLYEHLWQNGFGPLTVAPTGKSAQSLFYQISPHLMLIDQSISDCNVIELCVEVLELHPATKVVLIAESDNGLPALAYQIISACISRNLPFTAWPGLLTYILSGGIAFSRGAMDALLADTWTAQEQPPHTAIGPLRLDLARRKVFYDGQRINLTPREFALLTCLIRNTDRVVTFDQILNEAWGYNADDGTPAQVRLYIARLRRKLLKDGQIANFIVTERGVGYRLHSALLRKRATRPDSSPQLEQTARQIEPASLLRWRAVEGNPANSRPQSLSAGYIAEHAH